eukprot:5924677-Pleurochrysis_carterae.AAC.1
MSEVRHFGEARFGVPNVSTRKTCMLRRARRSCSDAEIANVRGAQQAKGRKASACTSDEFASSRHARMRDVARIQHARIISILYCISSYREGGATTFQFSSYHASKPLHH